MVTTFNFMLQKEQTYPIVEEQEPRPGSNELLRVQIQFALNEHGIALYNKREDQWCCYIRMTQAQAQVLESRRMRLGLSYMAPAGRPVGWLNRGANRRLCHAVSIEQESEGGDFWAGIHLDAGHGPDTVTAIAALTQLNTNIKAELRNDPAIRRQAGNHTGV